MFHVYEKLFLYLSIFACGHKLWEAVYPDGIIPSLHKPVEGHVPVFESAKLIVQQQPGVIPHGDGDRTLERVQIGHDSPGICARHRR